MSPSKIVMQWEAWVYGLVAGFIGGGANAAVASVTASMIAPDKFNLGTQLHNFLLLVGVTFLASGILSALAYLAKSPLPPMITLTEEEKTITPTGGGGVAISTVSKTTEVAPESKPNAGN